MLDSTPYIILDGNGNLTESNIPKGNGPDVSSGSVLLATITEETDRERLLLLCSSGGKPIRFRLQLGKYKFGIAFSNTSGGKRICEIRLFDYENGITDSSDFKDLFYGIKATEIYSDFITETSGIIPPKRMADKSATDMGSLFNPIELTDETVTRLSESREIFSSTFSHIEVNTHAGAIPSVDGISFSSLLSLVSSVLDKASSDGIIDIMLDFRSESYSITLSTSFASRVSGFSFDITFLHRFIPSSYTHLTLAMYIAAKSGVDICAEVKHGKLSVTFGKLKNAPGEQEFKYTASEYSKSLSEVAVALLSVKDLQEESPKE